MRRILFISLLVLAVGCASVPSHQVVSQPGQPTVTQPTGVTATQANELTVYITDTGKRYHLSTCRYLSSSKHAISMDEAKRRGYTPCKVCRPPT